MRYTQAQHRDLYLLNDYLDEVRYTQAEFDRELHWVMIEYLIQDCFKQYFTFLTGSFSLEQWFDLFRERCYVLAQQQDFNAIEAKEIVNETLRTYDFVCFTDSVLDYSQSIVTPHNHSLEYVKL